MLDSLIRLDHWLFFFINNGWAAQWLDPVFEGLSELGAWTIVIVAAAALAADGRKLLLRHLLVVAIFLSMASATNSMVKHAVNRSRPLKVFETAIAEGRVHVNHDLETHPLKHHSFPSGHSMLAFFMMTYLGQCKRSYRPYALFLAAGVALSRVYVGAHFPFDCLGGALLGALWALVAWKVFETLRLQAARTS